MRKGTKIVFLLSLSLNLIGVLIGGYLFIQIGGVSYVSAKLDNNPPMYDENTYYIERTNLFEGVTLSQNSTVFIGDSITQRGLWEELFPNSDVVNRGVNSDSTEGVLNRLDSIIESNPKKVFLMIGVNDLYAGLTTKEITTFYDEILNKLREGTPETEVFVQSVLPLNYEMYYAEDKIKNETVQELNKNLQVLSEEYNYTYVDLYSNFEKDGQLNEQLSYDGIHLSGEGYNVWKNSIEQYVQ